MEEKGVSISEIFKVIFKRVWWVVATIVVFMLAFVLLAQFVYNPQKQTYTVRYNLSYPYSENGKYPDGTEFRLGDLKSVETLNQIKSSDSHYSSIDVDSLVYDDDLQISQVVTTVDGETVDSYVELSVKAKYFKDKSQALSFIRAIVEYPINKVNGIVSEVDYNTYLNAFDSAKTYEAQIKLLEQQRDYIYDMYADLIDLCGQYYLVNGYSLKQYSLSLAYVMDSTDVSRLNDELVLERYVKDDDYFLTSYQSQISALLKEKAYNEQRIENLRTERDKLASNVNVESFNEQIVQLVNANSQIDIDVKVIEEQVAAMNGDSQKKEEFEAKLKKFHDDLAEATQTFKNVRIAVYEEKSAVTYQNNKITADGGLNILFALIIGAVLGFIVAGVVICIVDMPKYLKNRKALEAVENN